MTKTATPRNNRTSCQKAHGVPLYSLSTATGSVTMNPKNKLKVVCMIRAISAIESSLVFS